MNLRDAVKVAFTTQETADDAADFVESAIRDYTKTTRVSMRLNGIREAAELRDLDAVHALTIKPIR